jgi:hypothetical protein
MSKLRSERRCQGAAESEPVPVLTMRPTTMVTGIEICRLEVYQESNVASHDPA